MDITIRVRSSAPDLRSREGQEPARQHGTRAPGGRRAPERLATVREEVEKPAAISRAVQKPAGRPAPDPRPADAEVNAGLASQIDRMIARRRIEYGVDAVLPSPAPRASVKPAYSAPGPLPGYIASGRQPLVQLSPPRHASGMPAYLSSGPSPAHPAAVESSARPPPRNAVVFDPVLGRQVRMGTLLANLPPKADHSQSWTPARGPLMGHVARPDPTAMPPRRGDVGNGGIVPAYGFTHVEGRWLDAPKRKKVLLAKGPIWCNGSGRSGVRVECPGVEKKAGVPALAASPAQVPSAGVGSAAVTQHEAVGRLGEQRHSKGSSASLPSPKVDSPMATKVDYESAFGGARRPLRFRQSSARQASTAGISGPSNPPRAPVAGPSAPSRRGDSGSSVAARRTPSLEEAYDRLQRLEAACQRFEGVMFHVRSDLAAQLCGCCNRRRALWAETERLHQRAALLLAHTSRGASQAACSDTALHELCEKIGGLEREVEDAGVALRISSEGPEEVDEARSPTLTKAPGVPQ
ncbi:hypothetical protein B0A55_08609 [Friedmanniomyces simplex]|uniref:Uncharacterized protein n=1 Tax=Friedmanniomyces simplex TaxID=329884 RepID=A0A4U0WX25_9PEZI|nr:hypothetical protein B0A55_08609 [Friedmanniomyces simplex]